MCIKVMRGQAQGRGCENDNVLVLQIVYEIERCYVNTDRCRRDGNIDRSNKQTASEYLVRMKESVLCVCYV